VTHIISKIAYLELSDVRLDKVANHPVISKTEQVRIFVYQ